MEAIDLIKVHPPVVHFAIALPFTLLVIDLYYRFKKIQPDGLHALITYLGVLAVVGGTISGIIAYEPIEDILYQISFFKIHKYLGLSMTPLFLALGVVKINSLSAHKRHRKPFVSVHQKAHERNSPNLFIASFSSSSLRV